MTNDIDFRGPCSQPGNMLPSVEHAACQLFEYVSSCDATARPVPYEMNLLVWRWPEQGWLLFVQARTDSKLLAAGIPCSVQFVPPRMAGRRYPTYVSVLVTALQLRALM